MSTVKMSLDDKIVEILRNEPMLSTRDIQTRLKDAGEERHLRTVQRYIERLNKQNRICIAGYREKGILLYVAWDEGSKYDSLLDCPEISEVDWKNFPRESIRPLIYLWHRGKEHPLFRDFVRLTLKTYSRERDSESLKKKISEFLKRDGNYYRSLQ